MNDQLETTAARSEAAKPYLEGLAKLSLYQIEDNLMELLALSEEKDLEPEAAVAIELQVASYFLAEVRKVDRIVAAIRKCQSAAEECRKESARLASVAVAWEMREKRIKDNSKYAMQTHGVRVIETPQHKLRICGNGGLKPLFVDSQRDVDEFHDIAVTMNLPQWCDMVKAAVQAGVLTEKEASVMEHRFPSFPNNDRIREALTRGETVPGAKLLDRGEHLRCE